MAFDVYKAVTATTKKGTENVLALIEAGTVPADTTVSEDEQAKAVIGDVAERYSSGQGEYVAIPAGTGIHKMVTMEKHAVVSDMP